MPLAKLQKTIRKCMFCMFFWFNGQFLLAVRCFGDANSLCLLMAGTGYSRSVIFNGINLSIMFWFTFCLVCELWKIFWKLLKIAFLFNIIFSSNMDLNWHSTPKTAPQAVLARIWPFSNQLTYIATITRNAWDILADAK